MLAGKPTAKVSTWMAKTSMARGRLWDKGHRAVGQAMGSYWNRTWYQTGAIGGVRDDTRAMGWSMESVGYEARIGGTDQTVGWCVNFWGYGTGNEDMGLDVELWGMIWGKRESYGAVKCDMGLWEGICVPHSPKDMRMSTAGGRLQGCGT